MTRHTGVMSKGKTTEFQTSASANKRSTFKIACILCGVIAFIQLMMMGVAVAMRVNKTRVVTQTIESEPEIYYIPTLIEERKSKAKISPRSYDEMMKKYGNGKIDAADMVYKKRLQQNKRGYGVEISPVARYNKADKRFAPIKNTQVEKLVEDAHKYHLAGDVVRAILKLDEAEVIDPKEPAIIYRRALVYEDMRNWERATDSYDALFEMGPEIGTYYEIAADKIANGVKDPPDIVPFQFGNVVQRISPDRLNANITIPIRRLTDRDIEPSQLDIRIFFYDIVDSKAVEPVPKQREKNITKRWLTGAADWSNEIEESIEAVYQLPSLDKANVHLFGERKYFGQVVEIYYKGELMDQYASPGRLHGIHAQEQFKHQIQPNMLPYDMESLDGDGTELLLPEIDN